MVNVDDDLGAMMSGGVLDVEPFLISRNTLGNGKTANSKSQTQMSNGGSGLAVVVAEVLVETRSKWVKVVEEDGGAIHVVGVEVTVPK